jgi:hypothetical protein
LSGSQVPALDPRARRLYATINVEVTRVLLSLAEASDPAFRACPPAEIKALLLGHMEAVVQRHHAASSR